MQVNDQLNTKVIEKQLRENLKYVVKYQDPVTGAHFEYKNMCDRLNKIVADKLTKCKSKNESCVSDEEPEIEKLNYYSTSRIKTLITELNKQAQGCSYIQTYAQKTKRKFENDSFIIKENPITVHTRDSDKKITENYLCDIDEFPSGDLKKKILIYKNKTLSTLQIESGKGNRKQ